MLDFVLGIKQSMSFEATPGNQMEALGVESVRVEKVRQGYRFFMPADQSQNFVEVANDGRQTTVIELSKPDRHLSQEDIHHRFTEQMGEVGYCQRRLYYSSVIVVCIVLMVDRVFSKNIVWRIVADVGTAVLFWRLIIKSPWDQFKQKQGVALNIAYTIAHWTKTNNLTDLLYDGGPKEGSSQRARRIFQLI